MFNKELLIDDVKQDHEKAEKWDLYLKLADIPEPTFESIEYLARSWKKWVASNQVTVLGGKQIDKYHKYADIVNRLNERIEDFKRHQFVEFETLSLLQKIRDGK